MENNIETNVVLVDTYDNAIGTMPKLEAHKIGILHRAFSIFIFNSKGQLLMQQRAFDKYHSGGLWSNSCCSHPITKESTKVTATKRLFEEMGVSCDLIPVSKFIYKAELDNGLIEHEFDHLFIGYSNETPAINLSEASAWKWMNIYELNEDLNINPSLYTVWLKPALENLMIYLSSENN